MKKTLSDSDAEMLTVTEAATALRCCPYHVRRLIDHGALRCASIGLGTKRRRLRVPRLAINEMLAARRVSLK